MKKFVGAFVFLFVLASSANGQGLKAAVTTDYQTLYDDYQANPIRADAKYKGKLLKVTGNVDDIGRALLGSPFVTFVLQFESGSVALYFRSSAEDEVASLTKGQTITVIGRCQGLLLSVVQLDDCVLAPVQLAEFFELVGSGTPQKIRLAINRGADVNEADKQKRVESGLDIFGMTPLMYAAAHNTDPTVITTLLKAGADIKAADGYGRTAVWYAAMSNQNLKVVTTLLKAGENVNARDSEGMTPLMAAAGHNHHAEVIVALLKAGADITAKAGQMMGYSALLFAAAYNPTPGVIKALLDAGADLEVRDTMAGGTALLYAAGSNRNPEVISALLSAGVKVEAQNNYGTTPLLAASYNNSPEAISMLLKAGANIEHRDQKGETALMAAAEKNPDPEAVVILLRAGANAKARDNGGNTAYDYAGRNEKLVETSAYEELENASWGEMPQAQSHTEQAQKEPWFIEGTWEVHANGLGNMTFLFTKQEDVTKVMGSEFALGQWIEGDWTISYERSRNILDAENQGQYRVVLIDKDRFQTEEADGSVVPGVFKDAVWTRQ